MPCASSEADTKGGQSENERPDEACGRSQGLQGNEGFVGQLLCWLAGFYWMVTTMIVIPFACIAYYYIILLPINMFRPAIYLRLENIIARFTNDHWMAAAQFYGLRVVDTGDKLDKCQGCRCVLMANHLALADHFVLMTSLGSKGSISARWLWLIFHVWKWTPVGMAWALHGNYMISGGRENRQRQLIDFRQHLRQRYWRDDHRWIVLYPEGTRLYLIAKSNQAYAQSHGLPQLRHCALPRTGAMGAILDETAPLAHKQGTPCGTGLCPPTCSKPVRYLVDATIGYPGGNVPTVKDFLLRRVPQPYTVQVHYRVLPMDSVPARDPSALRNYLIERWLEKDQGTLQGSGLPQLLEHFYANGTFPWAQQGAPRECPVEPLRAVAAELFFWCSWACHVWIWLRPASFFIVKIIGRLVDGVVGLF